MTSLAVKLVRSSTPNSKTRNKHFLSMKVWKRKALRSSRLSILTISRGWEAQVPHAVADQLGQLFPLRAPVQVEALLSDALGVVPAGVPARSLPPHAFLTQTTCPLHALLPQQGVV